MSDIRKISVEELKQALESGACQLVDVREPAEFDAEKIAGATLVPLSALEQTHGAIDKSRRVYLLCGSGKRAAAAAEKLAAKGYGDLHVVAGGMLAWTAAGHPAVKGAGGVWPLERQVRFAAGLCVFVFSALGWFAHPGFIGAAAFVGAGLVFAAVTDTCGMAMVLAKMPWNQSSCGRK